MSYCLKFVLLGLALICPTAMAEPNAQPPADPIMTNLNDAAAKFRSSNAEEARKSLNAAAYSIRELKQERVKSCLSSAASYNYERSNKVQSLIGKAAGAYRSGDYSVAVAALDAADREIERSKEVRRGACYE